ncbi:MAG: NADH-quinone oxidoreductase subunit H, partial [Firmicutes bacterium]|nr:NADH-quinone oxidoreductase subunit H [Bacillota bacterium]
MVLLQIAGIAAFSPLLAGWIKWLKARLQRRPGPSILQPYRDLRKLLRKESLRSDESSFVSVVAPYVVAGSALAACGIIPVVRAGTAGLILGGSVFALLLVMALGRFWTVLLGLDSGSAFAGMAAGRDLLFALLTEPVALLAVLAVALTGGMQAWRRFEQVRAAPVVIGSAPAIVLAFAALLIVVVAETGRLPIDNPDT